MEKIIDALMEQAEDCLREYAKKEVWSQADLEPIKCAVSIYEKLHRIAPMCYEYDGAKESHRSYGMRHMSMPYYAYGDSRRAPRRYEYDGSLTSYRDGGGDDASMRRRSSTSRRGYEEQSMHSVNDRMIACLEGMMDDAASSFERDQILEMINIAKSRSR